MEMDVEERDNGNADDLRDADSWDGLLDNFFLKALIIAAIFGLVMTAYLLWFSSQESHPSIYLYPDSYSNYGYPGETIGFKYGIINREGVKSDFTIRIYLGTVLVKTKTITLEAGERWEDVESVTLPKNQTFPVKVRVVAQTDGEAYDVYFWVRSRSSG